MLDGGRGLLNIVTSFICSEPNDVLWGQAGLEPGARGPGTAPDPTAPPPIVLSATPCLC